MTIKFTRYLFPSCALLINANQHGINQLDLMLFGLCLYGKIPRWIIRRFKVQQLFYSAGLWRGNVFSGEEVCRVVLLCRP
jgi:hypothetical protein